MYANANRLGCLLTPSHCPGQSVWFRKEGDIHAVVSVNFDHTELRGKFWANSIADLMRAEIISSEKSDIFCHKIEISIFNTRIKTFQDQLDFDMFSSVKWSKGMCLEEIALLGKNTEDASFGVDSADVSA